jgi:IclR family transcriptional regulator, acetate operon repressor
VSCRQSGVRSDQRDEPSVLGKAFRVLDSFGPETGTLSLGELARRSALPKSTVHRIAGQLAQWGALERTEDGFRLGIRLFEWGSLVPHQRELREAAVPFMEDLFESTHETVHLGMLDGIEVMYVDKITGHRGVSVPTSAGRHMPAYCTGLGKAILAFSDPELTERVISSGLRPRTAYTIVVPDVLREELARVRSRGVAYDHEESVLGVACAAAPVRNQGGTAVAALSVTGPTLRLDPERLGPAVRTAALGLTRMLRSAPAA